ncbi:MAG: FxsA family protein [Methylococcaceae bacterium]|nr:MAG: FxsA family protein [Methylococcaceae bacterium]
MNIFRIILIVLLSVPVVEIFLLVQVGGLIGVFPTIILVIGTGVWGAYLFHTQGLNTWQRLQNTLARGEVPTQELVEGPLVLLGGVLLLTPGFVTDLAGLVCLLPQSRRWLAHYLLEQGLIKAVMAARQAPAREEESVIEGEFRKADD